MRIRIQLINFVADPDFDLMRMQIQVTKMMRIRIHNTGYHRFFTWILLVRDNEAGPHDEVDEDEGVVGEGQQVPGHWYTLYTSMQQQLTKQIKLIREKKLPKMSVLRLSEDNQKTLGLTGCWTVGHSEIFKNCMKEERGTPCTSTP